MECGFTLKCVCDMTRTYSQSEPLLQPKSIQHDPVMPTHPHPKVVTSLSKKLPFYPHFYLTSRQQNITTKNSQSSTLRCLINGEGGGGGVQNKQGVGISKNLLISIMNKKIDMNV